MTTAPVELVHQSLPASTSESTARSSKSLRTTALAVFGVLLGAGVMTAGLTLLASIAQPVLVSGF